jgi:lipopolysaccharide biosynthesis glycosyltransferase
MIHICLPLYDRCGTYSKNIGVVICSVMDNTKFDITFHLIHDDTLSDKNIHKIKELVYRYQNAKIIFYKINSEEFNIIKNRVDKFSVGTLFRLKIPEFISDNIDKVIYLDADLIVNLEINHIWSIDISNYSLAACVDYDLSEFSKPWLCRVGLLPVDTYFNGGVLILNLKKIRREHNLVNECIKFLMKYPQCQYADQDAFNFIFQNDTLLLEKRFNLLTRAEKGKCCNSEEGIYHFAGVKPRAESNDFFDKLFYKYLSMTPWIESPDVLQELHENVLQQNLNLRIYRNLINNLYNGYRVVIWGAGSILLEKLLEDKIILDKVAFLVDKNQNLIKTKVHGFMVESPNMLKFLDNKTYIIVLSNNYYRDIFDDLINMGWDSRVIINGSMLCE